MTRAGAIPAPRRPRRGRRIDAPANAASSDDAEDVERRGLVFGGAVGDRLVGDRLGRFLLLLFLLDRLDRRGDRRGARRRRRARRRRYRRRHEREQPGAAGQREEGRRHRRAWRRDAPGGDRRRRRAAAARRRRGRRRRRRAGAGAARAAARRRAVICWRPPGVLAAARSRTAGARCRLHGHRQRGGQPAGADRHGRRARVEARRTGPTGARPFRFGIGSLPGPAARRAALAEPMFRSTKPPISGSEELNVVFGQDRRGAFARRRSRGSGCRGRLAGIRCRCRLRRVAAGARAAREPGEQRRLAAAQQRPVLGFEREFADHGDQRRAVTSARFVAGSRGRRVRPAPSRMPLAPWKLPARSLSTFDVAERARADSWESIRRRRAAARTFSSGES